MMISTIDSQNHHTPEFRVPLTLPAEVVSGAADGEARVRFLWLGETVADHIEKLVFRRHRRKIAGSRQQRA
jgi:hypothetical protein